MASGRARLAEYPGDGFHEAWACEVESLRVRPDSLQSDYSVIVPAWATLPQYVPLQLEAFVRGRGWIPVVIQHIIWRA